MIFNRVKIIFILVSISGIWNLLLRLLWKLGYKLSFFYIIPLDDICFYSAWAIAGYTYFEFRKNKKEKTTPKSKKITGETKAGKEVFSRGFLLAVIISLSITAFIGIGTLLFGGSFDEIKIKILATTLFVGLYSLAGLACSAGYSKTDKQSFFIIGLVLSTLGMFSAFSAIWLDHYFNEELWRTAFVFLVMTIAYAHIFLLMSMQIKKPLASIIRLITCGSIIIVAVLICSIIINGNLFDFDIGIRTIGIFTILGILGTVITPLIERISKS